MNIDDLVGRYYFQGKNQEAGEDFSYEGILTLKLDEYRRVVAHWQIDDHEQNGYGFFKDDILVINFHYEGDDGKIFKGVAVYRALDENTLDGFWSEKYGDPHFLGAEYCTKLEDNVLWN